MKLGVLIQLTKLMYLDVVIVFTAKPNRKVIWFGMKEASYWFLFHLSLPNILKFFIGDSLTLQVHNLQEIFGCQPKPNRVFGNRNFGSVDCLVGYGTKFLLPIMFGSASVEAKMDRFTTESSPNDEYFSASNIQTRLDQTEFFVSNLQ